MKFSVITEKSREVFNLELVSDKGNEKALPIWEGVCLIVDFPATGHLSCTTYW